ncbi:MAG: HDIG domain-containing protein [Desulfohalobiaceae bacterium]|nr:HDIG domain-containing protein [Desulfohalobiaceae bacterium]
MQDSPLAHIRFTARSTGTIPEDQTCFQFWRELDMPEHIGTHSLMVARIATSLATWAKQRGWDVRIQEVRAAALLHDLGKAYTIVHQGSHSQIGASLVMQRLGNPAIAQGVIHHVHWPGELNLERHFLPLTVLYADKRVVHDRIVSVRERFEDIVSRYAHSFERMQKIYRSHARVLALEKLLTQSLEVDVHAYPFDRRGMVQREGGLPQGS